MTHPVLLEKAREFDELQLSALEFALGPLHSSPSTDSDEPGEFAAAELALRGENPVAELLGCRLRSELVRAWAQVCEALVAVREQLTPVLEVNPRRLQHLRRRATFAPP